MGPARFDFGQQVPEAVDLHDLQLDPEVLGEAPDQFVIRALGSGLANEIRDGAVAGDNPQFTQRPDFLQEGWPDPAGGEQGGQKNDEHVSHRSVAVGVTPNLMALRRPAPYHEAFRRLQTPGLSSGTSTYV